MDLQQVFLTQIDLFCAGSRSGGNKPHVHMCRSAVQTSVQPTEPRWLNVTAVWEKRFHMSSVFFFLPPRRKLIKSWRGQVNALAREPRQWVTVIADLPSSTDSGFIRNPFGILSEATSGDSIQMDELRLWLYLWIYNIVWPLAQSDPTPPIPHPGEKQNISEHLWNVVLLISTPFQKRSCVMSVPFKLLVDVGMTSAAF